MARIQEITTVDESLLAEVVRRIRQAGDPERIILFGSHAYGDPDPRSDLDLLIVQESTLSPHQRAVPIYRALAGLLIPKDILVYTPSEAEAWSQVPESLVAQAFTRGKELYHRTT
jgi:predicted nucleotidyltransferase